ncbi:phosphate acyltransferase PlsX [Echinimonas agarilytica]|uniref:Phosphate acyltransferase n=1 Tax=Echinimonas agarilytica TaxID=1215918 RepID=A0AA42B7Y7_9GAMM|nr:phosphate acyltransferase PlsX [Echinimonas agarilytica]MCM2679853.1 phosphate acyltransferase PlsX [Echinimonas agarilytica]
MRNLTVALDVMGGDFGPSITLSAASQALSLYPNLYLLLVGQSDTIQSWLYSQSSDIQKRCSVIHSEQVIEMDERPVSALRNKRQSSMRLALDAVANGQAQACVSAGNTGALMAISRMVLKMLPGIERPALIAALPTLNGGRVHMLDLGANVDCDSDTLFQFALMGSAMTRVVEGISRPRVALLNIGEEEIKGNDQIKQTAQLLHNSGDINYTGYIEGNALFTGQADVVVCDGFVGNICLKTCEGLTSLLLSRLFSAQRTPAWKKWLIRKVFPEVIKLKDAMNPDQYNGASLLGLRGIVVKSHGNADENAMATAIGEAVIEIERQVPERIADTLESALMGK